MLVIILTLKNIFYPPPSPEKILLVYQSLIIIASPVAQQDFWGAVLQRATEGIELLSWLHVGCTTKVYQLEGKASVNNDILILRMEGKEWRRPQRKLLAAHSQSVRLLLANIFIPVGQ